MEMTEGKWFCISTRDQHPEKEKREQVIPIPFTLVNLFPCFTPEPDCLQ